MRRERVSTDATVEGEPPLAMVVCALPEELEALVRRLDPPGGSRLNDERLGPAVRVRAGRLAGRPVVVAATGDGERNARLGVSTLLEAFRVDHLVIAGVSGGLSPQLAAGAIVVGERVLEDTDESKGGPRELVPTGTSASRLAEITGGRSGRIVTTRRLACTPDGKAALYARFAPEGGHDAAVVDLESAFYASAAQEAGVPWTVVRAVSDTASEPLPGFLERCRDAGGSVSRWAVLRYALRHPSEIPGLFGLRRRVRRCARGLGGAVERLFDAERGG